MEENIPTVYGYRLVYGYRSIWTFPHALALGRKDKYRSSTFQYTYIHTYISCERGTCMCTLPKETLPLFTSKARITQGLAYKDIIRKEKDLHLIAPQ